MLDNDHYDQSQAPRAKLDSAGRCCGRKPLVYKRPHHLFCSRCDRSFDPITKQQIVNWAWECRDGCWLKVYPDAGTEISSREEP